MVRGVSNSLLFVFLLLSENTKVRKSNKTSAFFRRTWKTVKKPFQKNSVEPTGISAQPVPEPSCVPGPRPKLQVDLVDAEQLCVAGPSDPTPQVTTETQKTQVTTESTQKRDVHLKADISSTISENGNDQGGMNISPATNEKASPTGECQQTI